MEEYLTGARLQARARHCGEAVDEDGWRQIVCELAQQVLKRAKKISDKIIEQKSDIRQLTR